MDDISRPDEIKRKIRKLKQFEIKIRFNGNVKPGIILVWDRFYDLHEMPLGKAKYSLHILASMSRDEYRQVIDEYLSYVYYELYKVNEIIKIYDPNILSKLNLSINADEYDIKKKFRELAKIHHPDTGGDAAKFIELMDAYRKLIGK